MDSGPQLNSLKINWINSIGLFYPGKERKIFKLLFLRTKEGGASKGGASKGGASKGGQIWLSAVQLSNIAGFGKSTAKSILKKAQYQNQDLITREAYGRGGKRREVLLSSLPKSLQTLYLQGEKPMDETSEIERLKEENRRLGEKYARLRAVEEANK